MRLGAHDMSGRRTRHTTRFVFLVLFNTYTHTHRVKRYSTSHNTPCQPQPRPHPGDGDVGARGRRRGAQARGGRQQRGGAARLRRLQRCAGRGTQAVVHCCRFQCILDALTKRDHTRGAGESAFHAPIRLKQGPARVPLPLPLNPSHTPALPLSPSRSLLARPSRQNYLTSSFALALADSPTTL